MRCNYSLCRCGLGRIVSANLALVLRPHSPLGGVSSLHRRHRTNSPDRLPILLISCRAPHPLPGTRSGLCSVAEEPLQSRFERHFRWRSAWPAKPRIEHVPGQPVLCAGLARFHDELVQPLGVVFHVIASTKALNRQPHGFVQRPRLQVHRVINTFRIPEGNSTLLHAKQDIRFAFCSPSGHVLRTTSNGDWSSRRPINRE